MNTLDILLNANIPDLPEAEYKIKRLSKEMGGDVVFRVKALPFSRVAELRKEHDGEDMPLWIVLEGTISPDLRSAPLREKYGAETPIELLKKLLLPGEIEDLQIKIERLSGYKKNTLEEVIKN